MAAAFAVCAALVVGPNASARYALDPALSGGSECDVTAILVNPCRPWLGAASNKYPQVATGLRSQIEFHEQRVGRQVDIVHAYNTAAVTGLTPDEEFFATRPGTILYLNWKPAATWAQADGSDPTVTANIDSVAASIKALGDAKIFLTVWHEPENDVSGGTTTCTSAPVGSAGTPEEYRTMWRYVRSRFDAAGVTNVVWAVNYMSNPSFDCMKNDLYPGNDLVDWVFFDNYGSGQQTNFVASVGRVYDLLASLSDADHDYASKPWGLAEWNIRGNVTAQQIYDYYDQAKAAVETNQFPRLDAYMVWDSVAQSDLENRILYGSGGTIDEVRQQHYAAFANSPALGGVAPPPPPQDTTAPSVPTLQAATASGAGISLSWSGSTDDVGVAAYEVYRDGQPLVETTATSYVDASARPGITYAYTVRARDGAGNVSAFSAPVSATGLDTTPPSRPGTPVGTVQSDDSVSLAWTASADDVAVARYEVWRSGVLIGQPTAPAYVDRTTKEGQSYSYTIYAADAAGNRSTASAATAVLVPDRLPPSAPASLVATSPSKRTVKLAWKPSTDNVGVAGYYVYQDGVRIATTSATGYTISGLTSRRTYSYVAKAFDKAGLVSAPSNTASVVVR